MLAIGIWQTIRRGLWTQTRWLLLAGWSGLVLAVLVGQIISANYATGQWEDYYQGPEIAGDMLLGQTFQPHCDGLNRVRLTIGISGPRHDQPVFFHLLSKTENRELYTEQFDAQPLADRAVVEFTFPPQANSHRQIYVAYLTSPGSHPGNSITLRGFSDVPLDGYAHGTAVVGQGKQMQAFPGDLAFAAYCRQGFWQAVEAVFAGWPGGGWLFLGVLLGHVALLGVALMRITLSDNWGR